MTYQSKFQVRSGKVVPLDHVDDASKDTQTKRNGGHTDHCTLVASPILVIKAVLQVLLVFQKVGHGNQGDDRKDDQAYPMPEMVVGGIDGGRSKSCHDGC